MVEAFEDDQVQFEINNNGEADQATHCESRTYT